MSIRQAVDPAMQRVLGRLSSRSEARACVLGPLARGICLSRGCGLLLAVQGGVHPDAAALQAEDRCD